MIVKDTVFILGAGASWHYGYPTGEALIRQMVDFITHFSGYCEKRIEWNDFRELVPEFIQKIEAASDEEKWIEAKRLSDELIRRIREVDPLVIDYFLFWNKDLQDIGNFAIAVSILRAGALFKQVQANLNRIAEPNGQAKENYNWYRFIIHKLIQGCKSSSDLIQNKVHFITFNYDKSFDDALSSGLHSNTLFDGKDVDYFLQDDRILHVYGSLPSTATDELTANNGAYSNMADLTYISVQPDGTVRREQERRQQLTHRKKYLDECFEASKHIKTIESVNKDNGELHEKCAALVKKAEVVYVLGFGFDKLNCSRIGLEVGYSQPIPTAKQFMFTNFQNRNIVTRSVAQIFGVSYADLLNSGRAWRPGVVQIEMSTKDVYRAFADDFDSPET